MSMTADRMSMLQIESDEPVPVEVQSAIDNVEAISGLSEGEAAKVVNKSDQAISACTAMINDLEAALSEYKHLRTQIKSVRVTAAKQLTYWNKIRLRAKRAEKVLADKAAAARLKEVGEEIAKYEQKWKRKMTPEEMDLYWQGQNALKSGYPF